VNEVHRFSTQTLQRAARHVRRALQHVPDYRLSTREKLDLLVCRLIRLGLQPNDLVRKNAEPALAAIASTIQPDRFQPPNVLPVGTIVVDSIVAVHDEVTMTVEPPSKAWEHVINRVLRMSSKSS